MQRMSDSQRIYGISSRCKECIKMKNQKYYKAHPEKWPEKKVIVPRNPETGKIHPLECKTCEKSFQKYHCFSVVFIKIF